MFNFSTDSKEIINNSIQNYILKLFKKRKIKECNVNQTKKSIDTLIENNPNSNEKVCENPQLLSSPSGNCNFYLI